ncbi:MAG: acyl transferase [Bacteroidota bacterium]|nr:acyl transferase [Bacteroidota bacterium]
MKWENKIFQNHTNSSFESVALKIFQYQAINNNVYKTYLKLLNVNPNNVKNLSQIPFLPIEFFKHQDVVCKSKNIDIVFTSSGTSGKQSKHIVNDLSIYMKSFTSGFEHFYGNIMDYTILALLPSYMERSGSSLIYMCEKLIKYSEKKESGFYLNEHQELSNLLLELERQNRKTILIGVSFALLDFVKKYPIKLKNTIVMETGGMKGKREEMVREQLHSILCKHFNLPKIHSEYGMTELLSQAYSKGDGIFESPPWMHISCRDANDPLSNNKKTGGINIIDLANVNSCSFIASQDFAKIHKNDTFEVVGRFDASDIRGCNLMSL